MFVGMDLGGVVESKPVAPGRYELVISTAEYKEPKSPEKAPMIQVSIGIADKLDAPNITHFISLPKAGEDTKKSSFKKLMLKRFLHQFGIPFEESSGFNLEDFAGATTKAQVNLSEPDPDSGLVYNRLVLDRLPDEGE